VKIPGSISESEFKSWKTWASKEIPRSSPLAPGLIEVSSEENYLYVNKPKINPGYSQCNSCKRRRF